MQIWVGTSGYAYPDWVNDFYPAGTSAGRMLGAYARRFPLVELNYTFYRPPTPGGLRKQAAQTPDGFQFIVKLHQSFSHENDLSGAAAFREAVAPLQAEGRLLALLCQYPQSFYRCREHWERLQTLAERFHGLPLAVEFRHTSWAVPLVTDWLLDRGLHLVSVDVPELGVLYPRGLVHSGRLAYVRFHSRRAESWYGSDKERYDYHYSDQELAEWAQALAANQASIDRALLLFNNCQRAHAAVNAQRMMALLREGGMEPVEPCAVPDQGPRQGSLFT